MVKISFFLFAALLLLPYSCKNSDEVTISPELPQAEIGEDIFRNIGPNALVPLKIENYLGNSQNIHPKVLRFPTKWKGYKYWMAYTPYPKGSITDENPSIAVSNDGLNWGTPGNLKNPLDIYKPKIYNSDTHLVFREDTGTLECWYRPFNLNTLKNSIVRRVSKDGINWGPKEVIFDFDDIQMLSPAIIYEAGKYKLWYCYEGQIRYVESLDSAGKIWPKAYKVIPFDWSKQYPWHMDVIRSDKGYEMVVCAWMRNVKWADNNSADLYYCATDLQNKVTENPFVIIERSKNPSAFDYRSIYRASILKINNVYRIYYSAIDNDWNRYMAMSSGTDIKKLKGFLPTTKL